MLQIESEQELLSLLSSIKKVHIYGARYNLFSILLLLKKLGYSKDLIETIWVTSKKENPDYIDNIEVKEYVQGGVGANTCVFLALAEHNARKVAQKLERDGILVVKISRTLINDIVMPKDMCEDVYKSIEQFVSDFEDIDTQLNVPAECNIAYAWTCWWQGLSKAPDIVRACINSHRKNLPKEVHYVIITEENYCDYIEIPDYIMEKMEKGYITLTTFSDIIRACLLYKYGGIWLDSTLLLHSSLPIEYFHFGLFTAKRKECVSYSRFSLWFLGGKSGNQLYQFLMEAFFYYFRNYDQIRYYLMIDFLIKIAFDIVPQLWNQYEILPYNNENSGGLAVHLDDIYEIDKYKEIVEGTVVQKLTWKLERYNSEALFRSNSFYSAILKAYKDI